MTIEAALGAEMEHHLGYPKHGQNSNEIDTNGKTFNGYYPKTVKGNHGEIELAILRDRGGSFEPTIIEKKSNTVRCF